MPEHTGQTATQETSAFFERPILNSPYEYPARHWELDEDGQPTQKIIETRRPAKFVTPIPKPKKRRGQATQQALFDVEDLRGQDQYDPSSIIEEVRRHVDTWRAAPEHEWRVTPETARLLRHWRHHPFSGIRPFFCQIEAVETLIWLTEVAPQLGKLGEKFLKHLEDANENANPGLNRLALKLATGAGKTTVMAMVIAWQTINAARHPGSRRFTRGFLVVTPGITIRDRLRVLLPNDADSYFKTRELVPADLLPELGKARIVITNYHAFKLRERMELSKGGRRLLQGRTGSEVETLESEGQMLQRVMPELLGMKSIMVLNDEAHHCYRERPGEAQEGELKGEDKSEAEKNNEAARLWISGLEAIQRKLSLTRVVDFSATPFFLRGSGYVEGTLFPWTMSDFSLMDAIECGIVKLPRVPVADNIPGADMPMYRNLWEHISKHMPKKGRAKATALDPLALPQPLLTALDALYGHYAKTFALWEKAGIATPPCFIVVCNNTAASKLVYDYIAGFTRTTTDGDTEHVPGRMELFRNHDDFGEPLSRPRTLLIDSEQLESGEALDDNFRSMAADEITRFKHEIIERTGDRRQAENLSDSDLLREVMNTVGKPGRLGSQIRCVVSVSMLTEGWDANTVTHVLGVRAFGTQLLCEQVIGRALRRRSYELNEEGLFNVEYADVLGIPFDFTAKPVIAPPQPPRDTVRVHAVHPERDHLEITFPRVLGYRVDMPNEEIRANFNKESHFTLTPALIGATQVQTAGIIGQSTDLSLGHSADVRHSTVIFELTTHLLQSRWLQEDHEAVPTYLFNKLKPIVREWLGTCFHCEGGTYPAQLKYKTIADTACEKIAAAITRAHQGERPIKAIVDAYNPTGSTRHVNFTTSKTSRWQTDARKCHINWVICDSDWEAEFCRVVEAHPSVRAYVKNHALGLEVPYRFKSEARRYLPDFILLVDDGHEDPLHLIVEIKGYRGEEAKVKKETMDTYWIPGVNNLGAHGRWAFAELTEVWTMEADMEAKLREAFEEALSKVTE